MDVLPFAFLSLRLKLRRSGTSLCTQHLKQSWVLYFTSCSWELLRRLLIPEPASTTQAQGQRVQPLIPGITVSKANVLYQTLLQIFNLSRREGGNVWQVEHLFFSWKLFIDNKHCHSLSRATALLSFKALILPTNPREGFLPRFSCLLV